MEIPSSEISLQKYPCLGHYSDGEIKWFKVTKVTKVFPKRFDAILMPIPTSNGNTRNHFVFTVYLDYRSVAKTLGITGQKGIEKAIRDHARKKSSPSPRNGRVTKYEVSGLPGTVIYEDGKRFVINNDATLTELRGK